MKTSFMKKQWAFLASFALVFTAISACSNGSDVSSTNENETSELDEDLSEQAESSSSERAKVNSSSENEEDDELESSSSSIDDDDDSSSSSKQTSSSSSFDLLAILSSTAVYVPLDTLEYSCEPEGGTRFYMVGKKQKVYEICRDGEWVEMGSSSSTTEESRHYVMDSLFNENLSYGLFKDERDNQSYKTIEIGTDWKIEVFAQNLNYGKQIKLNESKFDDKAVEKYCYNDDSWFCENGFGGLYTWSEAMGLPHACDSVQTGSTDACPHALVLGIESPSVWDSVQIQGVCPKGWHVLNKSEWKMMVGDIYVGDHISRIFGNEDKYGFSALPAGMLNVVRNVEYQMMPEKGYMWLPEENDDVSAHAIIFDLVKWSQNDNERQKASGMSVRCVKNYKAQ